MMSNLFSGLKFVTLLENSSLPSTYAQKLSRSSLYVRQRPIAGYNRDFHEHEVDILLLLFYPGCDEINQFVSAIEETKVRRSLLVINGSWKDKEKDHFKSNLEKMQNLWFYLAHVSADNNVIWKEVITLQTGYTMNQLSFLNGSLKAKDDYNLNGLRVRATSLTWAPFLTIDDCNEEGLECAQYYGYLKDYMDAMATELNFTYDTYKDLGCCTTIVMNNNTSMFELLHNLDFIHNFEPQIICALSVKMSKKQYPRTMIGARRRNRVRIT